MTIKADKQGPEGRFGQSSSPKRDEVGFRSLDSWPGLGLDRAVQAATKLVVVEHEEGVTESGVGDTAPDLGDASDARRKAASEVFGLTQTASADRHRQQQGPDQRLKVVTTATT
ncbi:MAG: hypothetical protein CMH57_09600, partial [Myxococcales bacterium]|nr:hypothetical protein [Myxococcales bacterium]